MKDIIDFVPTFSWMRAIAVAALCLIAACSFQSTGSAPNQPSIVLSADKPRPTIDVVDVPAEQLRALQGTDSRDDWSAVLKVSVGPNQPATVGNYEIADGRIVFTPMFPLDPGRQYHVTYSPAGAAPITSIVSLPERANTPVTMVTQVYPTADVVPANQRRLYIHFSAPMGLHAESSHLHLFTEDGAEVADPFVPFDARFFSDDRKRYTVSFDPARQQQSLIEGKSFTLVVDSEWRDANGLPLVQTFKRTFKIAPPDDKPPDPKTWKVLAPPAGTLTPLSVAFPEPLDHALLDRGLGVVSPDGTATPGTVTFGTSELTWLFTPQSPWAAGAYNIVAFTMLEDLAGNRIAGEPEKTFIAFVVR